MPNLGPQWSYVDNLIFAVQILFSKYKYKCNKVPPGLNKVTIPDSLHQSSLLHRVLINKIYN